MHLREMFLARELQLQLGERPTLFSFQQPTRIQIALRHPSEAEADRRKWHKEWIVCDAECAIDPDEKALHVFESLALRKLPDGVDRSRLGPGYLDSEGKLLSLGFGISCLPAVAIDLIDTASSFLHDYTSRIIQTLRWRLNLPQAPTPISWVSMGEFSLDGQAWHQVPSRITGTARMILYSSLTPSLVSEVTESVDRGDGEPLPHVLLREAVALGWGNQRSSLLIAFAAAEIALKQHIARMVPDAGAIVADLPAPPITKLLKHVAALPAATDVMKGREVPKAIRDTLREAMELRNELAHRGEFEKLTEEVLDRILSAVRDLLWFLDARGGNLWALEHIGRDPGYERCHDEPQDATDGSKRRGKRA